MILVYIEYIKREKERDEYNKALSYFIKHSNDVTEIQQNLTLR